MLQPHVQDVAANNILIALGSNVASFYGDAEKTVSAAFDYIEKQVGNILKKSKLYQTPCFPAGFGPDYINAAVCVETNLSAAEILEQLHNIENYFGRQRVQRWGNRSLDLDLLAIGDLVLPNQEEFNRWHKLPVSHQKKRAPEELILPHPRIQDRTFVLVPLNDVAPDWRHPVLGVTVAEMLSRYSKEQIAEVKSVP